ncbi:TonB family protein [Rufibacter roseus]|uniref:TonB family protein n=1 Tax=Rufibacter roseus TaxID=1567108 RepID=A0ABW2DMR0_9BACT|nr:TonB family protein [Rufibacter roseus]
MKGKLSLFTSTFLLFVTACQVAKDHDRLAQLAFDDQKDRKENSSKTSVNDYSRTEEVYKILSQEELKTSTDFYNAALILQHGGKSEDFKQANLLAKKAVELNPTNADAKALVAMSLDRYLESNFKPQWYGTQFIELGEKKYLHPIDTTIITEQERKELGVQSLSQILDYLNKQHQKNESDISAYFVTDSLYRVFYPEVKAEIVGTFEQLLEKIKYPEEALKNNITGKVLVQYTIDPDGFVKDAVVVDGIGYGCDEEALRVINLARFKNYMNQDIERRSRVPFEIKSEVHKN